MSEHVGIIHPGNMGVSVAASAQNSGCTVHWASEGRSAATRRRAQEVNLQDEGSLARLCQACETLISVVPPHAAEEITDAVIQHGFEGRYLDANAVSPQRTRRIAERMAAAGIAFVDGGIIGGPAWEPGRTWLYLAGADAARVTPLFAAGPLETEVLGEEIGQAAALKMCFAANSKGTTALLCAILAAAEQLGVRQALERQWARYEPEFPAQTAARTRRVTAKAWRFAGEMEEIAATLETAGLPGGFHTAAAELYRRIADFKDAPERPALEEVLAALVAED
jgi:3-hydroxyisobutyrate dehydrogenase-like beta-hydroxyacid dehydrogenase